MLCVAAPHCRTVRGPPGRRLATALFAALLARSRGPVATALLAALLSLARGPLAFAALLALLPPPALAAAEATPRLDRAVRLLTENCDPARLDAAALLVGALEGWAAEEPRLTLVRAPAEGPAATLTVRAGDVEAVFELGKLGSLARTDAAIRALATRLGRQGIRLGAAEDALVDGLLRAYDPHSVLLRPAETALLRAPPGERPAGVGISLALHAGLPAVQEVIDGAPAARAGILERDQLQAIDGQPTAGLSLEEVGRRLRGSPGSPVSLALLRGTSLRTVVVRREPIRLPSAVATRLGTVGYLRLAELGGNAAQDVAAGLAALRATGPLQGLILDLRGNPGGLVDQAVQVADLFLDGGLVVETVGARTREPRLAKPGRTVEEPVVVLVDEETASAAEIVAGALRLNGRAVLVGSRTFGKGTVQVLFDLPDGYALKLTVAEYQLAGGYAIRTRGLVPDVALVPVAVGKHGTSGFAPADLGEERLSGREGKRTAVVALHYLAPERLPSPGSDPAVLLAAGALATSAGQRGLLPALKAQAAILAAVEGPRLSRALEQALSVDWSPGGGGKAGALQLEAAASAGKLAITLRNRGTTPARRLRVWTRASYPPLDRHEHAVGLLAPGAQLSIELPLPAGGAPRRGRVPVHVEVETDAGSVAALDTAVELAAP